MINIQYILRKIVPHMLLGVNRKPGRKFVDYSHPNMNINIY